MKAYKLKESINGYDKDRMFCNFGTLTLLLATPKEKQGFVYNSTVNTLNSKGLLEEFNLEDEKWIHPHLYKPIRQALNI